MELLIWLMIGLLCGTKLLDVLSTIKRIDRTDSETNPFTRKIMELLGMKPAILFIFLITLTIIFLSSYLALRGELFMQMIFVFAGTLISIVQGAVAHANWFGIDNGITNLVRKIHNLNRN